MRITAGFNGRTIGNAQDRQSKIDGWGYWCAKCGKPLWQQKWKPVARIPGHKDTANCLILCSECAKYIEEQDINEVPFNMIPYYHMAPRNWHPENMFDNR